MPFNDKLNSKFIEHAIDLEKYKAGERRKALKLLKSLEQDLVAEIARADLAGYDRTAYQTSRLNSLLRETRATIGSAYKELRNDQNSDWGQLAQIESDFVMNSINTLAGVELASTAVSPDQLRAIVSDMLIDGAPSSEWWSRQADDVAAKFADTVRKGILRGDTNDEIVRAVRSDVTGLAAKNADALTSTSISAVSSHARVLTYEANDDVVGAIMQHSTLDARTTPICIAYSGAMYSNDGKFTPLNGAPPNGAGIPRHFRCRAFWLPVVKSFAEMGSQKLRTGGRPSESADRYFRQRLRDQGLSDDAIARAVMNAQASMDGQVPETFTYEQWLKTKSPEFQQQILGPGKYKLWKEGKISLRDLVDQNGDPLTIEELKKRAA